MKVKVRYRGHDNIYCEEIIDLPQDATVMDLVDRFDNPLLKSAVIKGALVQPDFVLAEGLEVFLFPQLPGG